MLRHPLTLLTQAVPPLRLAPGETWLLAQDLHAPFTARPGGALATLAGAKVLTREFDEYAAALDLVTPNVTQLLAAARASGLGVVYSCLGAAPGGPPSAFQAATGWTWTVDRDAAESFSAAWQPQAGEPVFTKPGWGALANPAFSAWLAAKQAVNVIVVGTMLDFGLRQTCVELADRGVGCLLVSDAVAPLTAAATAPVTGNLAHGLVKLRSTAELLDLLARMRETGAVQV